MNTATTIEWVFLAHMVLGLIPACFVLAVAAARLNRRRHAPRDAVVSWLAWERLLASVIMVAVMLVGAVLGALIILAPANGQPVANAVEDWARETARFVVLPAVLLMTCGWPYLALWMWGVNTRLDAVDRATERQTMLRLHAVTDPPVTNGAPMSPATERDPDLSEPLG